MTDIISRHIRARHLGTALFGPNFTTSQPVYVRREGVYTIGSFAPELFCSLAMRTGYGYGIAFTVRLRQLMISRDDILMPVFFVM